MINALYEPFPETVTADGRDYSIITDFRDWLLFGDMLADAGLSPEEKASAAVQWLKDPPGIVTGELIGAMLAFYRGDALVPDKAEPEGSEGPAPRGAPLFSWRFDSKYVLGDFRRYYAIDLRSADMHWWDFLCLFSALPDSSCCQKRIAYRSADPGSIKDSRERQRIMEIQRRIAVPYEMTDDEISAVFEV